MKRKSYINMQPLFIFTIVLCFATSYSTCAFSAPITLEYRYDELGRLVELGDSVNGDRAYHYDAAGNRTSVCLDDDCGGLQTLPSPTNLSVSSMPYTTAKSMKWSSVPGATYYLLRTADSNESTVPTSSSSTVTGVRPTPGVWVKACDGNGCSSEAYF